MTTDAAGLESYGALGRSHGLPRYPFLFQGIVLLEDICDQPLIGLKLTRILRLYNTDQSVTEGAETFKEVLVCYAWPMQQVKAR